MSDKTTTPDLPLPQLVGGFLTPDAADYVSIEDFTPQDSRIYAYTDTGLFAATGVKIAFTTRHGGLSTGPFASLNLGSHVKDDVQVVEANRAKLMEAVGVPGLLPLVPNQVHGTHIVAVSDGSSVAKARDAAGEGADGISCTCADVAVLLCFADCLPVIAVAPNGSFCVAHAGWRGAVAGIAASAVRSLCTQGIGAQSCNVYIGPYIHAECFEVGTEVSRAFKEAFGPDCVVDDRHVDLGSAVRIQVQREGVLPERIADVDACTLCHPDIFFSYRASDGKCGRHGAMAVRMSSGQKG